MTEALKNETLQSMVKRLQRDVSTLRRQARAPLFSTEDGFTVDFVETEESTGSINYVDLSTVGPTVTCEVSPSGRLLVILGAHKRSSTTVAANVISGTMSFELSGANVLAPHSKRAVEMAYVIPGADGSNRLAEHHGLGGFLIEDLVEGDTTITAKYGVFGSPNCSFAERIIIGIPL